MTCWVPGADGSEFGIDNIPLGIFSCPDEAPRPGAAIGEAVLDLHALDVAGLIAEPSLRDAVTLNAFLGCGRARWSALRARLRHVLSDAASPGERAHVEDALIPHSAVRLHVPIAVGDYVDFYSSIEHATNVGRIFRPNEPLGANYRYVPLGYHGRASSVVVGGSPVTRPAGQRRSPEDPRTPTFGPSTQLDFELELGAVVGAESRLGCPIPIGAARAHLYGFVLLNDWSARDLQAWETVPLGPFAGKSFATSISPWVVSLDALEPFRRANRVLEPEPFPYLRTDEPWAYDIELDVLLLTPAMRARDAGPASIARVGFRDMYWNAAQQLAHLTANGARVRPGDLHGSGTISGSVDGTFGSLLEATRGGTRALRLPGGEERTYLLDGDTVIIRAAAVDGERRIGFGELRGTVVA